MKKSVVTSIVALVFAAGLVIASPVAASAQVPPPTSTNCTVTAGIYTSGTKVVMDSHIYPCTPNNVLVDVDVYYMRGSTTLKHVDTGCGTNSPGGLARCETSWNSSFTNPSGKQAWQVVVWATYTNLFGGTVTKTDNAGGDY